ncbi:hypothetical protein BC832DRAFT_486231 [Gaertneriomyces semiglobifer]|nr:hypothetical protein BC832DRAFT_486231 [Gaertneriomyces semiglobifer]
MSDNKNTFSSLTVVKLRALLKQRSLSTQGKKADLVQRLEEHEQAQAGSADEPDKADEKDISDLNATPGKSRNESPAEQEPLSTPVPPTQTPSGADLVVNQQQDSATDNAEKSATNSLESEAHVDLQKSGPSDPTDVEREQMGSRSEERSVGKTGKSQMDIADAGASEQQAPQTKRKGGVVVAPITKKLRTDAQMKTNGNPEEAIREAAHDTNAQTGSSEATERTEVQPGSKTATETESLAPPTTGKVNDISTESGHGQAEESTLVIRNFVRPLTLPQVREFLAQYGTVEKFWMDRIKTHCYVTFGTPEEAAAALKGCQGLKFPPETGKSLSAEYISREAADHAIEEIEASQPARGRTLVTLPDRMSLTGNPLDRVPIPRLGRRESSMANESSRISAPKREEYQIPPLPADSFPNNKVYRKTRTHPPIYYKTASGV